MHLLGLQELLNSDPLCLVQKNEWPKVVRFVNNTQGAQIPYHGINGAPGP